MKCKKPLLIREMILCALFFTLIALGAFIKIPLPAAPFTLQFMFTNLAGLLLGKRLGSIAVAAYITAGIMGIPVFASGGGPGYIFQPTFGYVIGYLPGVYVTGYIVEKMRPASFTALFWAGIVNVMIVYAFGIPYYYYIVNYYLGSSIGVWPLLFYGIVLTLPGKILICTTGATISQRLIPVLKQILK